MKTNAKGIGLHALDGPSDGIRITPATPEPECDLRWAKSSNFRPLMQRLGFSVVGEKYRVSFVFGLYFRSRPSAITGFVISVYVDAIYRVLASWGLSHVGEKRCKAIPPSVAHGDASPTINRVIRAGRVVAPSFDVLPSAVLLGSNPAKVPPLPVRDIFGGHKFFPQAPAGFCQTSGQCRTSDGSLGPAGTGAYPRGGGPLAAVVSMLNKQSTEYLTRKINKSWHFFTSKWFTVIGAWQSAVNRFSGATLAKPFHFNSGVA